jgi:hypothetical protein
LAPLLLCDKAGFVNETCAIYHRHHASETSKLTMEERLSDEWTLANAVANLARRLVSKPQRQQQIILESRKFFVRRLVSALSRHREQGGDLAEVLRLMWRWRHDLAHIGLANLLGLARPLAVIFAPRAVAGWARQLKRILAARTSRNTQASVQ